ncbi:MAG: ribonuclease HII [Candidatus Tectomicrobia bacterium]|nr:ribonuclease HII [Candidatus Tectomicrobia bacterium]
MARRDFPAAVHQPFEQEARQAGYNAIAGIDEAGRGPLAGPVVAAAVFLPAEYDIPGLQDSKQLTEPQREAVYGHVLHESLAYGVGVVSHRLIDRHNILWATREAMLRAVRQLATVPDLLLIDGPIKLSTVIDQRPIVRGDSSCASIAAASVVAKVTRDRMMVHYDRLYPVYGFARHKGYPTRQHYARLRAHGPCAIHRLSFRGVAERPAAPLGTAS